MLIAATRKESVTVEVSNSELIDAVLKLYKEKNPRPFCWDSYIDGFDGCWRIHYYGGHNGGDWDLGREATEEEIAAEKRYDEFLQVLRSLK